MKFSKGVIVILFIGLVSLGFIQSSRLSSTGTVLGSQISTSPQGRVLMIRPNIQNNTWIVLKPDGTNLDISGSKSQGLQEAIDFANTYGYPLYVEGGGYSDLDGRQDYSAIRVSGSIRIPPCTVCSYIFQGVDLYFTNNMGSNDGLIFDSADMMNFYFRGQIIYQGTGSAVRIVPINKNSEDFTGFTSSTIDIGVIAVVGSDLQPIRTGGLGMRISSPKGPFINSKILLGEINGGVVGFQVDNPSSSFEQNIIESASIHTQGSVSVQIGTDKVSNGRIYGNQWKLNINSSSPAGSTKVIGAINTWSNNDLYFVSIRGGGPGYGIAFNENTSGNKVFSATNTTQTPVVDIPNSTNKMY